MKRTWHNWSSGVLLLIGMSGCTALPQTIPVHDRPYLVLNPSDSKELHALIKKAHGSLKACTSPASCDALYYEAALGAMFRSRAEAIRVFSEIVQGASSSPFASRSAQWLAVLNAEETPSEATLALLSQYARSEILSRPEERLQTRIRTQDRKIEQLTRQLELLKHIDQGHRTPVGASSLAPAAVAPE